MTLMFVLRWRFIHLLNSYHPHNGKGALSDGVPRVVHSMWALEHCKNYRISPPHFLTECRKRQLSQGSFVLLCFVFFFAVLGCV